MDSNRETTDISDTIVVGGDYSEESHDETDASIDYGEGEDVMEQDAAEPVAAVDDYATTFDSPAAHGDHGAPEEDAQPDVSMASESMNSPSAPDPAAVPADRPQSPALAPTSSPPPAVAPASGSPSPSLGASAPSEQASQGFDSPPPESPSVAAQTTGSPSSAATSAATALASDAAQALEQHPTAAPIPDAASVASAPTNEDDAAIDIRKLVADITGRAITADSPTPPPAQAPSSTLTSPPAAHSATAAAAAPPAALPVSLPSSLPPKPSLPNRMPTFPTANYSFQPRGTNVPASPGTPQGTYPPNEGISSLPAPPTAAFGGSGHSQGHRMSPNGDAPPGNFPPSSIRQLWDQFQVDEKQYTSEAKWERFPEGSRIFIGNLSSERVSKREVFDVFHQFGRLAQISLKSAYGFVQYHTIAEGNAAMQGAQGIELGGRRIHLEISRAQKKKDERDRSPDRRGPRGSHGSERFDTGDRNGWRRDDYRPGRSPSPRRHEARGSRDGPFHRDREFGSHGRRRSRSPQRFNRHGEGSYRRRSPSPHRRAPSDGDRLDLPRRFGADVPDVQILLLQEVSREFVGWVQGAFHNKGLRTDVMYINPRFPREAVVQRQVAEGVHGIVDLDFAAQTKGKIPIQLFIRSGGNSVRFELYQDVDPPVAAELVIREKSQPAAQFAQQPQQPQYPPNYGHQQAQQQPPAGYPYPYGQHPGAGPGQQHPQQQQPGPGAADLASMVGNLDNAALHALLASLQAPQQQQQQQHHPHQQQPQHPHPGAAAASQAAQIDMNALLGNLRNAAAAQQPGQAPGGYPAAAYGAAAAAGGAAPGGYGGMDAAQQVQSIMEQLKRAAH